MIWPNDTAAWLVELTGATGQMEGMMILAGMSLWYSVLLSGLVGASAALVVLIQKPWRN